MYLQVLARITTTQKGGQRKGEKEREKEERKGKLYQISIPLLPTLISKKIFVGWVYFLRIHVLRSG